MPAATTSAAAASTPMAMDGDLAGPVPDRRGVQHQHICVFRTLNATESALSNGSSRTRYRTSRCSSWKALARWARRRSWSMSSRARPSQPSGSTWSGTRWIAWHSTNAATSPRSRTCCSTATGFARTPIRSCSSTRPRRAARSAGSCLRSVANFVGGVSKNTSVVPAPGSRVNARINEVFARLESWHLILRSDQKGSSTHASRAYLPKRYLFDTGVLRELRESAVPAISAAHTIAPAARSWRGAGSRWPAGSARRPGRRSTSSSRPVRRRFRSSAETSVDGVQIVNLLTYLLERLGRPVSWRPPLPVPSGPSARAQGIPRTRPRCRWRAALVHRPPAPGMLARHCRGRS